MSENVGTEFGDRVRRYRERRGMTQATAGALMGYSEDWWSKVERGIRPVDKYSNLSRMAEILEIDDISELKGTPLACAVSNTSHHSSVAGIRAAMTGLPAIRGAALPGGVLPGDVLERRVGDAWSIYDTDRARYDRLGPMLPELLGQAYRTVRAATAEAETLSARRSLISIHHLLQVYLKRLGEGELAWLAADRALTMASDLGDPVWTGASAWNLGAIALNRGDGDVALQLAQDMIGMMKPIPDDASPEYISVYGALHLVAVIAAARTGQSGRGWDYLREAGHIAARLGADRNDFRTSFGPTNVAMHAVHLAGEDGDFTEALRLADDVAVEPGGVPLERHTRYLVEVMQAHRLKGDKLGTLYMLKEIVGISPVEAQHFSTVREAVRDLIRTGGARHQREAEALANAVGVIA